MKTESKQNNILGKQRFKLWESRRMLSSALPVRRFDQSLLDPMGQSVDYCIIGRSLAEKDGVALTISYASSSYALPDNRTVSSNSSGGRRETISRMQRLRTRKKLRRHCQR